MGAIMKGSQALIAFTCGAALLGAAVAAAPAIAAGDGKFQVRVRALAVIPDEDATIDVLPGGVEIDTAYVPEVDFTYLIDENWRLELIAAVARHDVQTEAASGNIDLGDVLLLPPTLTLQYHFMPEKQIHPYVGAGVNYTFFFENETAAVSDAEYDDSFGWALQAGLEFKIDEAWHANLDVKKIFLDTDVSLANGAINADVDIDPWIIGFGFGYRF